MYQQLLIKGDKKMKTMVYFVVGLFLFGSFAAINISEKAGGTQGNARQENISLTFSGLNVAEKGEFVELEMQGTNSWNFNSGQPLLPIHVETMTLPFGATINNIVCDVQGVKTEVLSKKIMPSPQPVPLTDELQVSSEPQMNQEIYGSEGLFPDNWFSYNLGAGLDENMEHKTFLTINTYPVRYEPGSDTIYYADKIDVTVTYNVPDSNPFPTNTEYKLVIIAPKKFSSDLQPLINHKISKGVTTILKTTEDIYSEFTGYDKPEQIKYFIKYALENWNTSYVLLVGGLKSLIYGNPRDNVNEGTKDWYVPVRYSNLNNNDEPGFISDLYYADVYNGTGAFCSWDSNGNHIYVDSGDKIDLYPDVSLSRLSCRNNNEVKSVVDKIINYESAPADPSWFDKMVLVAGDGFLDQEDLDISWNTNSLPNGQYTIYAQSTNDEGISGPIDQINVTIDKTKTTTLTFLHDDNLITGLHYPFPPVAEIVSVSEGNILGNTDYTYTPTEKEAYCNGITHWANLEYRSGILKIRGKSYDPQPYGNVTDLHVWVNNSGGTTVFSTNKNGLEMYYEGEWTTGEKLLNGRAGAAYYMPSEFQKTFLWSSSGNWTGQTQVIDTVSQGCGFLFLSGHGSPAVWANHYPGIPGNRQNASVQGLYVIDLKGGPPFLPMDKISNGYKDPVVVVGGCHNSMFNVSLLTTLLDLHNKKNMQTYGNPTAECWSERFVRLSKRGAIATMGNTGFGYGVLGEWNTVGGYDNYITTEFFVQYGTNGHKILGDAYSQTLTEYINHFKGSGDWDKIHEKTVEQWVLLGDPSLVIGGYT